MDNDKDLLPRKIYLRNEKNSDHFDLILTREMPTRELGDNFFTYGIYSLTDIFILGSSFHFSFKDGIPTEREPTGTYNSMKEDRAVRHLLEKMRTKR